ncbi:hypothetical protein D3C73_567530 [compost metagenome]
MSLDRNDIIVQFFAMIRRLNRTGSDILEVRDFFWLVSEIRAFTPPTVEFMTVLKTYRPVLYHEFKTSLVPNSSMCLLANVHIDVGMALINLGITDEEQLYACIKGTTATRC